MRTILSQSVRELKCVGELFQIALLPGDSASDESIAWFVNSTQCRRWLTDEYAKLLCYVEADASEVVRTISKVVRGLCFDGNGQVDAIAYVDLSKYKTMSRYDTQAAVLRSIIRQLLAQVQQPQLLLYDLYNNARRDGPTAFLQIFESSGSQCQLGSLVKVLNQIICDIGKQSLSILVINGLHEVTEQARKPLLELLKPTSSLGSQTRTLICASTQQDVLKVLDGLSTVSVEGEMWRESNRRLDVNA